MRACVRACVAANHLRAGRFGLSIRRRCTRTKRRRDAARRAIIFRRRDALVKPPPRLSDDLIQTRLCERHEARGATRPSPSDGRWTSEEGGAVCCRRRCGWVRILSACRLTTQGGRHTLLCRPLGVLGSRSLPGAEVAERASQVELVAAVQSQPASQLAGARQSLETRRAKTQTHKHTPSQPFAIDCQSRRESERDERIIIVWPRSSSV
jgi:hypothetical protein